MPSLLPSCCKRKVVSIVYDEKEENDITRKKHTSTRTIRKTSKIYECSICGKLKKCRICLTKNRSKFLAKVNQVYTAPNDKGVDVMNDETVQQQEYEIIEDSGNGSSMKDTSTKLDALAFAATVRSEEDYKNQKIALRKKKKAKWAAARRKRHKEEHNALMEKNTKQN